MKVAVRLVCVFGCSFLSKEDLTLQRDLILSFFFFFFFNFYLFLAALGLCCYVRAFSSCGEWVCSLSSGYRLTGFSSCGSRAVEHRLSSCGTRA